MVAFSFVQPDTDEIHNWFISARETKACWKTWPRPLTELSNYRTLFFFSLSSRSFSSRGDSLSLFFSFPFFLFSFFFFSSFISRSLAFEPKCRAHASNVLRFFAEIEIGHGLWRRAIARIAWPTVFTSRCLDR